MTGSHTKIALGGVLAAVVLGAMLLGGCSNAGVGNDIPTPEGLSQETTETSLYYSTGRSLLEEHRLVDATDPYQEILDELLAATPQENADVAIVQPVAEYNSIKLDGDMIVIDWTPEILDFEATDQEKRLALAAFLATFGEFQNVKTVEFTVDGETSGDLDGKKIEDFWGEVSLANQPWDVIRVPHLTSGETTDSATQPGLESTSSE